MMNLSSAGNYYLYVGPTDMCKSFHGLSGLVQHSLNRGPGRDEVFCFINRKRDKLKILQWQGGGFVVWYKRLEEGTFEPFDYAVKQGWIELQYTELIMLIDGLSIKNTRKRKRYLPN
jgi:transposase